MSTKEVQYKDYVNFLDGYKNNANLRAINKPKDAVDNGSATANVATTNLKPFNQYIENYNTIRYKPVKPTFINQHQQQIQDECKKDINSIVRNFEKNSLEEFTEQKRSVSRNSSSSTSNSTSSNSKTRGFPLPRNGSISSSRSSTASSINSPSPNHSMSSEFPIISPPISPPPSIASSTEDYSMISPCNSPPPPPPPLPIAAPPKFKSPPRQFVSSPPHLPVTNNNSPCQRVVKIQINSNDKNASKIIDQNDPRVKKAVYGALRNMYGAYHEKANQYVATLPKNRVRKGNNLDKIIDSIAAEGGLEKLCGRAKIEAD